MRLSHAHHKGYVRWSTVQLLLAFLLLTATLGVAVGCVIKSTQALRGVTQTEQHISRQRRATNKLLTELLNASIQAEVATVQYADDEELQRYLTAVKAVDKAMDHLCREITDSTQLCRADSLQTFIWLRRDGTINLINTLREENRQGDNLQKQIDKLHNEQRMMKVNVDVPVIEQGEKVVIERRKRGFFRRLGDAFRRAKDDTISRHITQQKKNVDTTHTAVDIADTMANYLADVHRHLQRNAQLQTKRVYHKSDELRAASALLSARMANLIDNFTTAQQRLMSQTVEHERRERNDAARQLSGLALLSILISAGLLIWLRRNIRRANHYRTALEEEKLHTEQLMERREQLLLTISHDIKAPINSIIGYLRLLPSGEVAARKELKAIDASSKHLLELVMSLLDYHKLEAGGIKLQLASTDAHQLLHTSFEAFRPIAADKGLTLVINDELPQGLWIITDAFRLRQVVDNLLSNALKYTSAGTVTLQALWDNQASTLHLSVKDTGCGLSSTDIARIFIPFSRVKGSEGQEGSGLGLSITQQLVNLLGGTLQVTSVLGQGSDFMLSLPCRRVKKPNEEKAITNDNPSLEKEHNVSVALIDDDALQLQLAEAMLHNVLPPEAEIVTFMEPQALLQWLEEGHLPMLLMTDIEMPSLSGYELLAHLQQNDATRGLRVVAMTSHSLVSTSELRQRGFSDVLFKPFTQNDLLRLFEDKAMENSQPPTVVHATSTPSLAPLLTFAEGDEAAEQAILQQFRSDCKHHLTLLRQSASEHDRAMLCNVAHKMLPTFTLIKSAIVSILQELDSQRDDKQWKEADNQNTETIINEITHILQHINAYTSINSRR